MTRPHKPKKLRNTQAARRAEEIGSRAEKEADAAAQAQINSIASALGARWDGTDWAPLEERRGGRR